MLCMTLKSARPSTTLCVANIEDMIKLSTEEIKLMQHAIGLSNPYKRIKNGIYRAYRNHYVASAKSTEWVDLVAAGLATKHEDILCEMNVVYRLTAKGIKVLSEIMNIKITEMK